jgi:hypothetical protein
VLIDDHHGALGAEGAAVRPVRLRNRPVLVGKQRNRQVVLLGERRVRVQALGGDADDDGAERHHRVRTVAVGAELPGADRRVVAGVEEQHDPLPPIVGQPEAAARALELEVRRLVPDRRLGHAGEILECPAHDL